MRILVLALGNDIMGDDGAAFITGDILAEKFKDYPDVEVVKTLKSGINLLDYFTEKYDVVIIVDTFLGTKKGGIRTFDIDAFNVVATSPHSMGIPEVIATLKAVGVRPPEIKIYAIEITDVKFSQEVSEEVKNAAKKLADIIADDIRKILHESY